MKLAGNGIVVQRLNREINEVARIQEVRTPLSPVEVAQRVREDLAAWKKIATDKNIVAE